jgi:multiple sugar transport system substrate-binding protein
VSAPLRGVAWNHTRAMAPLQALSWVLSDRAGETVIEWDTRSLKSFGEDPLDLFNADYDLIVFDYPFAGEALASGWLRPLAELIPDVEARRDAFVGRAFDSFVWNGQVAALPIDVACQVRAWRPDLFEALREAPPNDWDETVDLGRRTGRVAMPMTPMGVWGALISLSAGRGAAPLADPRVAFPREAFDGAWRDLARLAEVVDADCFQSSPVAVLNRMSTSDDIAYCPITYGYSTYAMTGYAPSRLRFGDLADRRGAPASGAILGGAGIGVSARSRQPERAAEIVGWLTSSEVQSTLYAQFGGQPAARAAWDDPLQDRIAGGFYSDTRAGMEACFHRPNRPGFHAFQAASAYRLHAALRDRADPRPALDHIDGDWGALSA